MVSQIDVRLAYIILSRSRDLVVTVDISRKNLSRNRIKCSFRYFYKGVFPEAFDELRNEVRVINLTT